MAAYRDGKRGKWYVSFHYRDWTGADKRKLKRGFDSKKEALEWEREFLAGQAGDLAMSFGQFVEIYYDDMGKRLRENTMSTKRYIIDLKILPYFKDRIISEITAPDIRKWQNEIMENGYSKTYLKTINNQLSAIFNYAVKYYDLRRNPCLIAGSMGKGQADEMLFWTIEEFRQFADCMMNKPLSYMAFTILFWTGIRLGELLALKVSDIDFDAALMTINKSLQRIKGRDVVTDPKTPKGNRVITLPDFLVEDIRDYLATIYKAKAEDRLVPVTKTYLEHEMERGIRESGVKRIHIHCLRHSNTVLLARANVSPVEMAERLGHEKVETTLNIFAHVFPGRRKEIAQMLDDIYHGRTKNENKEES